MKAKEIIPDMKCIHCGKTVGDDARFCKYCGTRLRRTCAVCGATLDEDARFCAACGAEALASLDFTKALSDLTAADWTGRTAARQNVSGFYFSRRISRQPRGSADNCFDICDGTLAFVEGEQLMRLTPELTLRRTDFSRDVAIKAVAQHADGIYAAGFDWGSSDAGVITLWKYDNALNLRSADEVMIMDSSAERMTCRMRMTDRHLFIFLWDNHNEGEREIIKYDLHSSRLERRRLGGKRVDLWYLDGERIFFRGEREDERFFGVLDTAAEPWSVRRIWTIGSGPDEIPDAPVYCDFDKGIAWTAATAGERRSLGLSEAACVARELAPGHKLLPEQPAWQVPETGAVNLFLDYFDGARSYKANNVLSVDACDPAGSRHRWKNTLHGDTENVIVWGDRLLADFTSHGYRIYAATLEGPNDVYSDGTAVREL